MVDPRTHQAHVGYAHELAANTMVSVDYTHVEGRNECRPPMIGLMLVCREAPYGVQLSPVVQWASARAYNLRAGSDLNADGNNNDRWIDPANGQQVSINAGRGDPTFVFDIRTTKYVGFGGDKRLGLFFELFNVFNTDNFRSPYQGNGRSVEFRKPNGYRA